MPSPYGAETWKTERSAVGAMMHYMRQIIEDKQLDLGPPDVDTSGTDRKSPDIIIYESRRSKNVLCVIEAKPPYYDASDHDEMYIPAWQKANTRKAKYFATTNFKDLIWFSTEAANALEPELQQIKDRIHLSELEDLDRIEEPRYKQPLQVQLEVFLKELYAVATGKKAEPKFPVDEYLVWRIHDKILRLSKYLTGIIDDSIHKDAKFASQLGRWFNDQGWDFTGQAADVDKTARQAAYLLVNKIIFYEALRAKRPDQLDPLQIPDGLTKGSLLQGTLQNYFNQVLKIDYNTVYTTDFIDNIAFTDTLQAVEVIKEIQDLLKILRKYDFASLGYDIIGRIFERLIPADERHAMGQYFTNPDVVDIINGFCIRKEKDKIFDPSCGAGTFLVRAYQQKKLQNQYLKHEQILDTLWGNDIAKFPAHLSTINLAVNDLSVDKNFPNIMREDFFALLSTEEGFELSKRTRKAMHSRMDNNQTDINYPRWFDCIVGNPPYTRQEEMGDIAPKDKRYKSDVIEMALSDNRGKILARISRRAGIYAYFFVHGSKFLRNGGRFGFVVSNSWLDVDYGKGLQEFFLKNFNIIAIIESKVERWFEDADINTCIIVLEKCTGEERKKERDDYLARFVYLKKPLRYFIPAAQDIWERQVERHGAIQDKFIKTILSHDSLYENEDLRIFPKKQSDLWDEGFDAEENKYVGAKWGKYLRAPDIFFKVIEKNIGKLVPLKKIAKIKRGITSGANDFFYLTEEEIKRLKIEREFWMHQNDLLQWIPNYVIKSPRECKSLIVNAEDLKYRILMIHKDKKDLKNTNILKYIHSGERKGFNKKQTCSTRSRWYDLGTRISANININYLIHDAARAFSGSFLVSDDFQEVHSNESILPYLNSTIFWLMQNVEGRTSFGGGLLKIQTYELGQLLICNEVMLNDRIHSIFKTICSRPFQSVFAELGASTPEEVSFENILPDRRELDKIIMGDILGLTDNEQLEIYRAVIDLVRSRLDKAKSLGDRKRTKEGINIELLVKTVMDKIGDGTLSKFYEANIGNQQLLTEKTLPGHSNEISIRQSLLGWRLYSGDKYIDCASEMEAHYLCIWLEVGLDRINVPSDENYLAKLIPKLRKQKVKIDEVIESQVGFITNAKTREKMLHLLWTQICSGIND